METSAVNDPGSVISEVNGYSSKSNKVMKNDVFIEDKVEDKVEKKLDSKLDDNNFSVEEKKAELEKVIEELNNITDVLDRKIGFELHQETETLMTQVIDIETRDVIKEMPPHEMLDLAAKINEMVGLLIDEKV